MEALPACLRDRIFPPIRPIYAGSHKSSQREVHELLCDNKYDISEFKQLKKHSIVVCLAPEDSEKSNCTFKVNIGGHRVEAREYSAPLFLMRVNKQFPKTMEIEWQYFSVKKYSTKSEKYVAMGMAGTAGTFSLLTHSSEKLPFTTEDIVMGWDCSTAEKLKLETDFKGSIAKEQYKQLVQVLQALKLKENLGSTLCLEN